MATYAFSDIHSNYKLFKQIQNYCKKDDVIFFLGDALDRGNDGIKIMQEIFNDNRFIYLLGNHELMFLDYVKIGIGSILRDKKELQTIKWNEGLKTLYDYQHLSNQEQKELIYNLKEKTFIKYIYNNKEKKKIVLCHSGCNPKSFLEDCPIETYIWDRKHLTTGEKDWNKEFEDFIVVHGHTPVQLLKNQNKADMTKNKIERYCGNHKIDLDLATFVTKKIALLNLDTLEEIYFQEEENNE